MNLNNENKINLIIGLIIMISVYLVFDWSHPKDNILLVDVDQIVKDIIHDPLLKDEEETKASEYFEKTFKKLDSVLDAIAKKEAKVIINKKAVLKGGKDITPIIRKIVMGGDDV